MASTPEIESHLNDELLIGNVLRIIHDPCKDQKQGRALWSVVGGVFAIGSTQATKLCQRFGYNPDVNVRKIFR